MEKDRTVLIEMIERLDKLITNFPNDAGLNTSKEIAIELLVKEKEQIKQAYITALLNSDNNVRMDAEDYYTKTYKNISL